MFLPNRKRIHGVFAMAVGAFAQNVITNLVGILASLWFVWHFLDWNIWLFVGVAAISITFLAVFLMLYFKISTLISWLDKISFLKKFRRF